MYAFTRTLEQMRYIYMHMKTHINLQIISNNMMISIKCRRKINIFDKKSRINTQKTLSNELCLHGNAWVITRIRKRDKNKNM